MRIKDLNWPFLVLCLTLGLCVYAQDDYVHSEKISAEELEYLENDQGLDAEASQTIHKDEYQGNYEIIDGSPDNMQEANEILSDDELNQINNMTEEDSLGDFEDKNVEKILNENPDQEQVVESIDSEDDEQTAEESELEASEDEVIIGLDVQEDNKVKKAKFEDIITKEQLTPEEFAKSIDILPQVDSSWLVDKDKFDIDISEYRWQQRSLIDWDKSSSKDWMSYDSWLAERKFKDENPTWKTIYRDRSLNEVIAKVISCVGECRLYKGINFSQAKYQSTLIEGDTIQTKANSYAWVYLMDGTLVRISPNTDISFNEIDISKKSVFYTIRMTRGNVYIHNRTTNHLKVEKNLDTDAIFLPLFLGEANKEDTKRKNYQSRKDKSKFSYLIEPDKDYKDFYSNINNLLADNARFGRKKTKILFVLPNANLKLTDANVDIFYKYGHYSMVKLRDNYEMYQDGGGNRRGVKGQISLRGYNNKESISMELGEWYKINEEGKEVDEGLKQSEHFRFHNIITKRFPTIIMAREIFIQKYSRGIVDPRSTEFDLAFNDGYRMWGYYQKGENTVSELASRMRYLDEYFRRVETTNLTSIKILASRKEFRSDLKDFDEKFYHDAFIAYTNKVLKVDGNEKEVVKHYKDLQYYLWVLNNAKGVN